MDSVGSKRELVEQRSTFNQHLAGQAKIKKKIYHHFKRPLTEFSIPACFPSTHYIPTPLTVPAISPPWLALQVPAYKHRPTDSANTPGKKNLIDNNRSPEISRDIGSFTPGSFSDVGVGLKGSKWKWALDVF